MNYLSILIVLSSGLRSLDHTALAMGNSHYMGNINSIKESKKLSSTLKLTALLIFIGKKDKLFFYFTTTFIILTVKFILVWNDLRITGNILCSVMLRKILLLKSSFKLPLYSVGNRDKNLKIFIYL